MDNAIKKAKNQYAAEYREKNRDRIREYCRVWRKNNPDKVKASQDRFWAKKAREYDSDQAEVER